MILDIDKVLCRETSTDIGEDLKFLKNKRILIVGAGGSIGSELCRQMLFAGAKRLFLFGHGEDSIYKTMNDLILLQRAGHGEKTALVPVIGEIQDKDFVQFLIERLNADVCFHTAAHKHVPLMEGNPVECIKNNVFGTKNLIDATKNSSISKFVFISSDKAVDPSCTYGVSKAIAEELVLEAGGRDKRFLAVRFGNVLGTKGSVIPLWEDQIKACAPVTITHPDMKRFFMSKHEAVSLIIKVSSFENGGELYALDMGEPFLMTDLAKRVGSQFNINPEDLKIEFIGTRPGEKLEEKLWGDDEVPEKIDSEKIIKISPNRKIKNIEEFLNNLHPICFYKEEKKDLFRNKVSLRDLLRKIYTNMEIQKNYVKY